LKIGFLKIGFFENIYHSKKVLQDSSLPHARALLEVVEMAFSKRKRTLSVCKKLKAKMHSVSGNLFDPLTPGYKNESWRLLISLDDRVSCALEYLNKYDEDEKEKLLDLARSEDVQQLVLLNIYFIEEDYRSRYRYCDEPLFWDRTSDEATVAAVAVIAATPPPVDEAAAPVTLTTAVEDIDEGDLVIKFESEADMKTKRDLLSSNAVVNYLALTWVTGRYLPVVTKIHSEAEDHPKGRDDAENERRLNDGSTDAWEDAAAAVDAFMNGEDDVDETLCILLEELRIKKIWRAPE
jgi:hypothetical protein